MDELIKPIVRWRHDSKDQGQKLTEWTANGQRILMRASHPNAKPGHADRRIIRILGIKLKQKG